MTYEEASIFAFTLVSNDELMMKRLEESKSEEAKMIFNQIKMIQNEVENHNINMYDPDDVMASKLLNSAVNMGFTRGYKNQHWKDVKCYKNSLNEYN